MVHTGRQPIEPVSATATPRRTLPGAPPGGARGSGAVVPVPSKSYHTIYYIICMAYVPTHATPPNSPHTAAADTDFSSRHHRRRRRPRRRCTTARRPAPDDREGPRNDRSRLAEHDQPAARRLVGPPRRSTRRRSRRIAPTPGTGAAGGRGPLAADARRGPQTRHGGTGLPQGSLARDAQELDFRAHVLSIRESELRDRIAQAEGRASQLAIEIEALTTLLRKEQAPASPSSDG